MARAEVGVGKVGPRPHLPADRDRTFLVPSVDRVVRQAVPGLSSTMRRIARSRHHRSKCKASSAHAVRPNGEHPPLASGRRRPLRSRRERDPASAEVAAEVGLHSMASLPSRRQMTLMDELLLGTSVGAGTDQVMPPSRLSERWTNRTDVGDRRRPCDRRPGARWSCAPSQWSQGTRAWTSLALVMLTAHRCGVVTAIPALFRGGKCSGRSASSRRHRRGARSDRG